MSRRLKSRWRRNCLVSAAALSLGMLTQLSGCGEYFTLAGITGVNFCSILNCESGTFFDFCGSNPLLIDCPNVGTTTDTTTTDTTTTG